MADNTLARRLLEDEEGKRNEAYKDHLGYWTIGIGHLLDQEQSEDEMEAMGLTTIPTSWEGFTLTDEQCYTLFDIDVEDAIDDLHSRDPDLSFSEEDLEALGETRRAILLSMVFQLGGAGFRKFRNFIKSVKAGDFETASVEMMDSLAARQTPERWERASKAMRLGFFEEYEKEVNDDTEKVGLSQMLDAVNTLADKIGSIEERLTAIENEKENKGSAISKFLNVLILGVLFTGFSIGGFSGSVNRAESIEVPTEPVVVEQPKPEHKLNVRVIHVEDLFQVGIWSEFEYLTVSVNGGNLIIDGDRQRTIPLTDKPLRIYDKTIINEKVILDLIHKGDEK